MKKLILIASLLMTGGLWGEGVCLVKTPLTEHIEKKCDKGDILRFRYVEEDNVDGAIIRDTLIATLCDFDKEIEVITYRTDPTPIHDNRLIHSAWCVYSGKLRLGYKNLRPKD
tara:strand:- start:26 stop:364 length:339 start_codon:yes stop_codon:yes gene_type:complete